MLNKKREQRNQVLKIKAHKRAMTRRVVNFPQKETTSREPLLHGSSEKHSTLFFLSLGILNYPK
jgi:hypothetical protein